MKYSVMAGGKMIRPVLCLAACEAVGGNIYDALPTACAIEIIHTYSLIHDDLPAMDNDKLRRGKPTSHIVFGEAAAILAGDALLTLAFEVLSSINIDLKSEDTARRRLKIIHSIALAAGRMGMVGGQMLDIESEGTRLKLNKLEQMHSLKTGALIEVSISSGAVLGKGGAEQIELLKIYAKNIGLAFQVADDILNIEGDSSTMGKTAGTDRFHKKSTYPSLLGLKKSKNFAKQLANEALQALDGFDKKSDPLRSIAAYIIERKK